MAVKSAKVSDILGGDCGLVRHKHWLLYGHGHGLGRGWMPQWLQEAIVFCWNQISCRLLGHSTHGMQVCTSCCRFVDPNGMSEEELWRRSEEQDRIAESCAHAEVEVEPNSGWTVCKNCGTVTGSERLPDDREWNIVWR